MFFLLAMGTKVVNTDFKIEKVSFYVLRIAHRCLILVLYAFNSIGAI